MRQVTMDDLDREADDFGTDTMTYAASRSANVLLETVTEEQRAHMASILAAYIGKGSFQVDFPAPNRFDVYVTRENECVVIRNAKWRQVSTIIDFARDVTDLRVHYETCETPAPGQEARILIRPALTLAR